MSTLVLCIDRANEIGRATGVESPVIGTDTLRSLVLEFGTIDPEGSGVNSLLATLQITESLVEEGEEALPVVVSGDRDSMVGADRSIAEQLDTLAAEYDPASAILVIDSAQDERVIPIVESRFRVDSVERVVVRQARDLESTYYLLKQFLADEELRQTVLVPIGLTLLVFPVLSLMAGTAVALASITTVIGFFLIYMGVGFEEHLGRLSGWLQESLYSGQVSIVTYVVAVGLLLVGVVAGALGVSDLSGDPGLLILAMQFTFDSVLWAVAAGIVATSGRLLDLLIQEERIRPTYLNLPFVILSVGLVLRGFSGYLLARAELLSPVETPPIDYGIVRIDSFEIGAGERLVLFVMIAILITVLGVRVASYLNERARSVSGVFEGEAG